MSKSFPEKQEILDAARTAAKTLGHSPSRSDFKRISGISEYHILQHFSSYREFIRAAGLEPDVTNVKLNPDDLLQDWGEVVRKLREIPTLSRYTREGKYSSKSFQKYLGTWAVIPSKFRDFAQSKPEWIDVVALLPVNLPKPKVAQTSRTSDAVHPESSSPKTVSQRHYTKLEGRQTYGAPIDFRGLRHEPVNEQGVVFLFGMIAKELGYMVEAVQTGYPDCEAKRQVEGARWQRVRIEFEFESRNFDHPPDGCDVIVCWRHNWPNCSENIEVVELSTVIKSLAQSDD